MKAKKVNEAIGDTLKPKSADEIDMSFEEYFKLVDKMNMMTMHYIRKDKANKDIYDKIIKDGYDNKSFPSVVGQQLLDKYNHLAGERRQARLEGMRKKRQQNKKK